MRRDVAHHALEAARHVVERAVGVDDRVFEQAVGIDVGKQARHVDSPKRAASRFAETARLACRGRQPGPETTIEDAGRVRVSSVADRACCLGQPTAMTEETNHASRQSASLSASRSASLSASRSASPCRQFPPRVRRPVARPPRRPRRPCLHRAAGDCAGAVERRQPRHGLS